MSRLAASTPARGVLATRTDGFIHTRLAGPIGCHAYAIGNAVRLGNVTIVIVDRLAAISVATAALMLDDLAKRLGPTYQHRFNQPPKANTLTALATLKGVQTVGDVELRAPVDRCGEASLTLGNVRLTVCDRDAATGVAKALAGAYDEAGHTFARLRPFVELVTERDDRRRANKARRLGIVLT